MSDGKGEVAAGAGIIGASIAGWVFDWGPEMFAVVGVVFIGWGFWKARTQDTDTERDS